MKTYDITWLSRAICFIKIIFQGMWINRFQLFLTTLTMAIGSLGLALTIFLGEGALEVLWADLENLLGSWTIIAPDPGPDGTLLKTRQTHYFTQQDFNHLQDALPMARMVTTAIFDMPAEVRTQTIETKLHMDAITKKLGEEDVFQPIQGRGISDDSYKGYTKECLATDTMMKALGLDLSDEPTILINGHLFKIVGVIVTPPLQSDRFPERIVVPYNIARTLWMDPGNIGIIIVAWHDTKDMYDILERIKIALNSIRGPQTFYLSSKQFQIQSSRKIVKTFIVVGTTQSIFCIFIASIGVLNVMLTNVARRTHEFAIRVAMGARQREILMVVLAESITVGLLGAAIGLLFAIAIAPFIGGLMAAGIEEAAQLHPTISFRGVVQPLLICGICSLIAGIIPALKVRNVDILAALRKNV